MLPLILFILGLVGIWVGWAWQIWVTLLLIAVVWEYLAR